MVARTRIDKIEKLVIVVLVAAIFFCSQQPVESILVKPNGGMVFNTATVVEKVRVAFDGGATITPTYEVGMPLGPEKALLEPTVPLRKAVIS